MSGKRKGSFPRIVQALSRGLKKVVIYVVRQRGANEWCNGLILINKTLEMWRRG